MEYKFQVKETDKRRSFLTVGLRGGYLFAPYSGEWKTGAAEIADGPNMDLAGPVFQMQLGFTHQGRQ